MCLRLTPLNRVKLRAPKMALVFTLTHVLAAVTSTPAPEDWPSASSPFSQLDDSSYTTAYINISRDGDFSKKFTRGDVGRYGGGYVGPAYGLLVHVTAENNPDDHSGCQLPFRSSRPDKKLPQPGEPWIALIKRGRCNFEVKVENAFKSNAVGVLVYNDRESAALEKMKLAHDFGRNISAVFTYKSKGEELARLAVNDSNVFVHITVGPSSSSRTATINRKSVLFVSITFIVLMIISLAWLVFYYIQRFRSIHAKDRLSRRLGNAAKKALSKIPTKNIKTDDKEVQDGECCAICIEPYKSCDVLRILPCTHEFHKCCIDPWLLEHRTCPMCKMDILKHYGFVFTGSQESILQMDVDETVGLDSTDGDHSPRRGGGISPLPEIRAVIIADHQRLFESSAEENSSRASTPDELTPSLSARRAVRQDLCVSCMAAAVAAATTSLQPVETDCSLGQGAQPSDGTTDSKR